MSNYELDNSNNPLIFMAHISIAHIRKDLKYTALEPSQI